MNVSLPTMSTSTRALCLKTLSTTSSQRPLQAQELARLAVQVFCLPPFLDKCNGRTKRRLKSVCTAIIPAVDTSFKCLNGSLSKARRLVASSSTEDGTQRLMVVLQTLSAILQSNYIIINDLNLCDLYDWPNFLSQVSETGICNHLCRLRLRTHSRGRNTEQNSHLVSLLHSQELPVLEHLHIVFEKFSSLPFDMAPLANKQFCKRLKSFTLSVYHRASCLTSTGINVFVKSCQQLTSLEIYLRSLDPGVDCFDLKEDAARAIASLKQLTSLKLRMAGATQESWNELLKAKWVNMECVDLALCGETDLSSTDLPHKAKWSLKPGARVNLRGFEFTKGGFAKLAINAPWFKSIGSLKLVNFWFEDQSPLPLLCEVAMPHLTKLHLKESDCDGVFLAAVAGASSSNLASIQDLILYEEAASAYLRAFSSAEWKNLRYFKLPDVVRKVNTADYYKTVLMRVQPEKWKDWKISKFSSGYDSYYHSEWPAVNV